MNARYVLLLLEFSIDQVSAEIRSWKTSNKYRKMGQKYACYDCTAVLQEDVFALEVFVDDPLVVEVSHPVGDLLSDDYNLAHGKLVPSQVEGSVQGVA